MSEARCWRWGLIGLLSCLAACIELEGQRINIDYDQDRDHLTVLVSYDGIHDHEEGDLEDSIRKLGRFVDGGDIMLVDWFGYIDRTEMRAWLEEVPEENPETRPEIRELVRALNRNMTVEILGHYRDPRGRIGAIQKIEISEVSQVIKLANEAINVTIVGDIEPESERDPMESVALHAARDGWDWIDLEGSAFVGRFPVPEGWAFERSEFLRSLLDYWAEQMDAFQSGDLFSPDAFLPAIAALSIDQAPGVVTVRVGYREEPTTIRLGLRRGYKDNVADAVIAAVPTEFDRRLSNVLLGGDDGAGVRPVLGLGPVPHEDQVRAMLWARSNGQREQADRWLVAFKADWERRHRYPIAPASSPSDSEWESDWGRWYMAVIGAVDPST